MQAGYTFCAEWDREKLAAHPEDWAAWFAERVERTVLLPFDPVYPAAGRYHATIDDGTLGFRAVGPWVTLGVIDVLAEIEGLAGPPPAAEWLAAHLPEWRDLAPWMASQEVPLRRATAYLLGAVDLAVTDALWAWPEPTVPPPGAGLNYDTFWHGFLAAWRETVEELTDTRQEHPRFARFFRRNYLIERTA